ncbi:Microcephalin [Chionoecetes opilio]|uniref:Microcephalin n=1 Tax=Chionoecetes opilio TaxID=41210 RepID=A0A8J4YAN5_CHIOP|nr:Microcephalin [Chionoecetes opilio]
MTDKQGIAGDQLDGRKLYSKTLCSCDCVILPQACEAGGMKGSKPPSTPGQSPAAWGEQTPRPYSFLLPQGRRGASLVVPDTPTNTPRQSVAGAGVTMVLETPDDPMEECEVLGGAGGSAGHTGEPLLPLRMRQRNVMSFLESDFFLQQQQQQQGGRGSLAPCEDVEGGEELTPRERREWSKVQPALGSPRQGRQRRSLANIIMPFDLNDTQQLAAKLSLIQQGEEKGKARRGSIGSHSTPRLARASSATPDIPKRRTHKHTHLTSPRHGVSSSLCTPMRPRAGAGERGRRKAGSTSTPAQDTNTTILFTNEDVELTPTHQSNGSGLTETDGRTAAATTPRATDGGNNSTQALQLQKSPLLQLRKFNAAATHKIAKELNERLQRQRRGEGEAKEGGGETHAPQPSSQGSSRDGSGTPASPQDPSSTLKDVVAYVEVRVDRDNRSAVIREQLEALGAKVETRLTRNTTHLIFREGSKAIFLRAKARGLHILSALWVEACRTSHTRAPEAHYPSTSLQTYSSDIHIPRKFRKQKSMQAKDFEEDMRIIEARMQRRFKKTAAAAAATATTKSVPRGLTTPRHRVVKEA